MPVTHLGYETPVHLAYEGKAFCRRAEAKNFRLFPISATLYCGARLVIAVGLASVPQKNTKSGKTEQI